MTSIALLPDGDVLAGAEVTLGPSRLGIAVTRLDAVSGAPSPVFNGGSPRIFDPCPNAPGGCLVRVDTIASTDRHVVISGLARAAAEDGTKLFASRLDFSAKPDNAFGQEGIAWIELGSSLVGASMVLQGERIVLASSTDILGDFDYALLRLSGGQLFKDQFESPAP